jgi:hypothetical protein
MTRIISWLLFLCILGVFGLVCFRALKARAEAGRGMPAYSVYSEDRDGLAPAAAVLQKLGYEPVALTRPIQHTAQREARNSLLILAEPARSGLAAAREGDLGEIDAQGLLNWVARGNTLLFCCRHMTDLHRALQLLVTNDARPSDEIIEVILGEAGPYTDGIDRVVVEGRDTVQGSGVLPLWWVEESPGALLVPRGKGRVLVVADPSILTLPGLRRANNLRFLVNVAALGAADGRVYFDEYHHGLRSGGGFWGYLHYHGQLWVLLVLVMAAGMMAWSGGMRLGKAVPAAEAHRADAVDYASAVARIYQRAGVRQLLAQALCRDFLGSLTRYVRLRRSALPAEILAAWRQQHPEQPPQALEALLRGVTTLRGGQVSQGDLLRWTNAFDRFQAEVMRAR